MNDIEITPEKYKQPPELRELLPGQIFSLYHFPEELYIKTDQESVSGQSKACTRIKDGKVFYFMNDVACVVFDCHITASRRSGYRW